MPDPTPMPQKKFTPPAPAVVHTTAPAALPKAAIQPMGPPKIAAAPAVAPVKTAAPASRPAPVPAATVARPAPAPVPAVQARQPERVVQQHPSHPRIQPARAPIAPITTNYNTFNYGNPPRHYPQQSRPQQSRPEQRHPHHTSPSGGGLLMTLFTGGMLGFVARGLVNNGSRPQSYPADYRGPVTGTHQLGMGKPMHPAVFESMMNAAIEGRPDTRVRLNNGEVVDTTAEERMMFKQLTFNMLQRPDQPLDERLARTLITPEALANRNMPGARAPGTHITHFSDEFGSRRLSELVDKNYNQLRDSYANEYQAYRGEMARQQPPRHHQTAFSNPMTSRPLGLIKLFGA